MPRRSKRIERSPERSWVIEDNISSDFTSSEIEPDAEEDENDHTVQASGFGQSHLTQGSPTSSSKLLREPEFIMPSLHVERASAPAQRKAKVSSPAVKMSQARYRKYDSNTRAKQGYPQSGANSADVDERNKVKLSPYLLWNRVGHPIFSYSTSVLANITTILKPFIAVSLAVWILALLGRQLFNSTVNQALAPLCLIPGVSSFNLPFCAVKQSRGPVEFDQLTAVQSKFEDVLSASSAGVSLPADMKRSESSIRDLRQVVQFSSLPSRNELVFEFSGFIDTARQASNDLTRFNSRVGRAVDNVLSTNRWTWQVIDGVAEREAAQGTVQRFLQETVLYPFVSSRLTEDVLFEQYLRHTRIIEDQIGELIMEAQALLRVLQNLDDRLDVIQTTTTRDGITVKGSKEELLAQLWTKLGGNRASKKHHDDQLRLLQQITIYRKTAWDYVSTTLLKLQSIAAGLEDLRERVAAPEVVGSTGAIPLRMHLEHIQLGVERLEAQRTEAKKVENDYQRKMLEKGGGSRQLSIS